MKAKFMRASNFDVFTMDEPKEKRLFENANIFFDTSSLLNIYYYLESTQSEIFNKLFKDLKKRLWITAHSEFEFLKNRDKVRSKPIETYYNLRKKNSTTKESGHVEEIDSIIKKVKANLVGDLNGQLKTLLEKTSKNDKHPFLDEGFFSNLKSEVSLLEKNIDAFISSFELFKAEFDREINAKQEKLKESLKEDQILIQLQESFLCTPNFDYTQVIKIVEEGELRYKNQIPPGYLDEDNKIGFQKYGDLIAWRQIIENAKTEKKDVILVIDDLKEDWWQVSEIKETKGPRHELIKEIYDAAGVQFWMYDIKAFLFKSKLYVNTTIEDAAIQDVTVKQESYLFETGALLSWVGQYLTGYNVLHETCGTSATRFDAIIANEEGKKAGFMLARISNPRFLGTLENKIRVAQNFKYINHLEHGLEKVFLVFYVNDSTAASTAQLSIQKLIRDKLVSLDNDVRILIGAIDGYKFCVYYDSEPPDEKVAYLHDV